MTLKQSITGHIPMPLALRLLSLLVFTCAAYAQTQPMPHIEGKSFAGQKVVLPDAATGHVAVLVFGFTKASKEPTRAWAQRTLREFGTQSGFEVYQLPVLEDVPRFVRGMVISSIKKGAPENSRDHFVPILHGESELKQLVGYKEPDDAYVVVLDPSGQIAGQMHGPFTEAAFAHLREELTLAIKIPSRN